MSESTVRICDGCGTEIQEGAENYLTGGSLIGVDMAAHETDIDLHIRQDCLLDFLGNATKKVQT